MDKVSRDLLVLKSYQELHDRLSVLIEDGRLIGMSVEDYRWIVDKLVGISGAEVDMQGIRLYNDPRDPIRGVSADLLEMPALPCDEISLGEPKPCTLERPLSHKRAIAATRIYEEGDWNGDDYVVTSDEWAVTPCMLHRLVYVRIGGDKKSQLQRKKLMIEFKSWSDDVLKISYESTDDSDYRSRTSDVVFVALKLLSGRVDETNFEHANQDGSGIPQETLGLNIDGREMAAVTEDEVSLLLENLT